MVVVFVILRLWDLTDVDSKCETFRYEAGKLEQVASPVCTIVGPGLL